jgi:hypothetical protein
VCDECSNIKTTYLSTIGVGYVFMYETNNNTSYPVEGAKINVNNICKTFGLFGKSTYLAIETYTTNAEGLYQVRFLEKGCPNGKYGLDEDCNLYNFYCNGKDVFGFFVEKITINAQNNIFMLDTIKLYK